MLTRIYGTAFFSKAELAEHLERLELAKARATTANSGASSGCSPSRRFRPAPTFWMPGRDSASSTTWWRCRERMGDERGYTEVKTPLIFDSELWKTFRALGQVSREHVHP